MQQLDFKARNYNVLADPTKHTLSYNAVSAPYQWYLNCKDGTSAHDYYPMWGRFVWTSAWSSFFPTPSFPLLAVLQVTISWVARDIAVAKKDESIYPWKLGISSSMLATLLLYKFLQIYSRGTQYMQYLSKSHKLDHKHAT